MRKLLNLFSRLGVSTDGVAAIEFAMVLPILTAIVVSVPDLSQAAIGVIQMENAARASVQYAMGGGTDMTAAQAVGMQTWTAKPSDAQLTASEACLCGASAGTCGQPCADGSNPQTYFTVVATGLVGGSMISFEKTTTRSVRLQ
jgi:Flp pilus assembly protein TadG